MRAKLSISYQHILTCAISDPRSRTATVIWTLEKSLFTLVSLLTANPEIQCKTALANIIILVSVGYWVANVSFVMTKLMLYKLQVRDCAFIWTESVWEKNSTQDFRFSTCWWWFLYPKEYTNDLYVLYNDVDVVQLIATSDCSDSIM